MLLFSVSAIVFGVVRFIINKKSYSKYIKVKGTIIDFVKNKRGYYPVIEYEAHNNKYKVIDSHYYPLTNYDKLYKKLYNKKVNIYYNPNNPKKALKPSDRFGIYLIILGLVILLCIYLSDMYVI